MALHEIYENETWKLTARVVRGSGEAEPVTFKIFEGEEDALAALEKK